MNETYKRGAG